MTIAQMFFAMMPASSAQSIQQMSMEEAESRQQRALESKRRWVESRVAIHG